MPSVASWLARNIEYMNIINLNDVVIRDDEPDFLEDVFYGDISMSSAHRQLAIGLVVGGLAAAFSNGDATMALAAVCMVSLFQICVYNDWVSVFGLTRVHLCMTRDRVWVEEAYARYHPTMYPLHRFAKDNFFIALGYAGGFIGAMSYKEPGYLDRRWRMVGVFIMGPNAANAD